MTTTTRSPRALLKHRSRDITEGPERAPARAMLMAMGLTSADLDKPFVAVANLASDVTPCNVHLDRIAAAVKEGIRQGDGTPFQFGTITVSDGISMGTEGMKASLVSREVIADSIETVAFGERMDGLVTVAGCDKNMPGCMMAIARLNIPSVFVYGGSILPGRFQGRDVSIQDVFEGVGAYAAGRMTREELTELECNACPGEGACAGMFTANTMSTAIEVMGLSLPGDAALTAVDPNKNDEARRAGAAVMAMLAEGVRPRDILTRQAFENAITVVVAMGGSTNAVLHLMAIAREAEVDLTLEDFDRISRSTPYIADMKPGGRYVMADLSRYGGVALIGKRLLDAGLLHGDAMSVNGKTLAENINGASIVDDQPVIYRTDQPRSPTGGLAILRGNLAPDGAVIKVAGHQEKVYQGPARVFDQEEPAFQAIQRGKIKAGDIVVIRYEGPKGGPGMRENAGGYGRPHRAGAGRFGGAGHGRAVFGRLARADGGPCGAGGHDGRPHRAAAGGRHHHAGHPQPPAGRPHQRGGADRPAGRLAADGAEVHRRRAGEVRQAGILGGGRGGNAVIYLCRRPGAGCCSPGTGINTKRRRSGGRRHIGEHNDTSGLYRQHIGAGRERHCFNTIEMRAGLADCVKSRSG